MSEYWDNYLEQVQEETIRKCHEAASDGAWWASKHPNATPQEVADEAGRRYMSFYERGAFEKEARDVIEIIKRKKKNGTE